MIEKLERGLDLPTRLVLGNQNRILAKLYPKHAELYNERSQIFEKGYTVFYTEMFEDIYDGLTAEDCRFVMETLDLYWDLQYHFGQLKNKEGIKAEDVQFPGWDGNEEPERVGFSEFLVGYEGKYEGLKYATDFDAQVPHPSKLYKQQLNRFEKYQLELKLTAAQMKEILGISGRRPVKNASTVRKKA